MIIDGTDGDDVLDGTAGSNIFDLSQGGEDKADGLRGNDIFRMGATLDNGDHINGAHGWDKMVLSGNYSDGVVFGDTTVRNIERIQLAAGNSYNLTTSDATVAEGKVLVVDASRLSGTHGLTFDGSAETDGYFRLLGGRGDDNLTGGGGNDFFRLWGNGGNDRANGGAGNDVFHFGGKLSFEDAIHGGSGNDTLFLDGNYSGELTLAGTAVSSIEHIVLRTDRDYALDTTDDLVAGGKTLAVNGAKIDADHYVYFFGDNETDGHFHLIGGAGDDILEGGQGSDVLQGNGGADNLRGEPSLGNIPPSQHAATNQEGIGDTFVYTAASDSTGVRYDTIHSLDFSVDHFVLPQAANLEALNFDFQAISTATFDADIATAVGDLGVGRAAIVDATDGDLSGHSFLVIDQNGTTGYQEGGDIVIDITGYTGLPQT